MRILVVDDHTIIRRGLLNLIALEHPLANATACANIRDAHEALTLSDHDVMILDLWLTDGNAFDHIRNWRHMSPGTRILVYSMAPTHLFAHRVMAMGCSGFVSKQSSEEEFSEALKAVCDGGTHFSAAIRQRAASITSESEMVSPFKLLSDRELSVLRDLLAGHGIKEISQRLNLSPSTVATYKTRMMEKVGVTNDSELRLAASLDGFIVT